MQYRRIECPEHIFGARSAQAALLDFGTPAGGGGGGDFGIGSQTTVFG